MSSWGSMEGSCGQMDKASDFESEDCRFESCHDQNLFSLLFQALCKEVKIKCLGF